MLNMHKEKKRIDFGFGNCCADATSLTLTTTCCYGYGGIESNIDGLRASQEHLPKILTFCWHLAISYIWKAITPKQIKIDPYCPRQNCSPLKCHFQRCIDFADIVDRRSSARGLQLHYTASRGFVSDSWAFLLPARRYASAGNSDRNVSVRLSVRHAPVLCQNEES